MKFDLIAAFSGRSIFEIDNDLGQRDFLLDWLCDADAYTKSKDAKGIGGSLRANTLIIPQRYKK